MMLFENENTKRREVLNKNHADNPEVGDYWHEMFCANCLVIGVTKSHVTFLADKQNVDANHWTWDTSSVYVLTRKQFAKKLRYSGDLKEKTYCDVVPNWRGTEGFIADVKQQKAWRAA